MSNQSDNTKIVNWIIGVIIITFLFFIPVFTFANVNSSLQLFLPLIISNDTGTPAPTSTPTATLTNTPTPTNTPIPADLIVGVPQLLSTPPIESYKPLTFQVVVTNTGETDINHPFYVDVILHPTPLPMPVVGFISNETIVDNLPGSSSQTVIITATAGIQYNFDLANSPQRYSSSVDLGNQVTESDENNNDDPLAPTVVIQTAVATPTVASTPDGAGSIWGTTTTSTFPYYGIPKVTVDLLDETGVTVRSTLSSVYQGAFLFNDVLPGNYTLRGCLERDSGDLYGETTVTIEAGQTSSPTFGGFSISVGTCSEMVAPAAITSTPTFTPTP